MELDPRMKLLFEIADDALHGVLGYYLFVEASAKTASFDDKFSKLPKREIPHSWTWNRRYSPTDLIENMEGLFDFIHARTSIVMMAGMFELALHSFAKFLNTNESTRSTSLFKGVNLKNPGYKELLKKTFHFVHENKQSLFGGEKNKDSKGFIQRIPIVCRSADDVRRLRNLIMHYHGFFNENYESDAIEIDGKKGLHPSYFRFKENREKKVPVLLSADEYVSYYRSHIELLHDVHDLIQRESFHYTGGGYYYVGERKVIDWHRVLIGE